MQRKTIDKQVGQIHFPTVAIAGLGLLGGALALALKRNLPGTTVLGFARRQESIDQAMAARAIDAGSTEVENVIREADLTVICMPINASIEFCRRHARTWRRGAVVTDVGSTKARIAERVTPILSSCKVHFIGGHPMAGSEKSGFAAATADLYQKATVFLTPLPENDQKKTDLLLDFWRNLGARPRIIDPFFHDALVARTSHLPHLLAPVLLMVALAKDKHGQAVSGGAFRDMTRIAASSPDMWLDIFQHNQTEILAAVNEFQEELAKYTQALRAGGRDELKKLLEQAQEKRWMWEKQHGGGPCS